MPTFNRNDTNAILAFFGQTSTKGSTQPKDEAYYTSNTPTNNRTASTRRPSSNVVTPTTAPGGLPRRPSTVPRDEAYYTSAKPTYKPPAAPKVKRKSSQPSDEEYYTNTDPPNRWRQEIQQPVFRGYDVGPGPQVNVSVGQRPNTGASAVQQSGTIGEQTAVPTRPRLSAYGGPRDEQFYTQRDAPTWTPDQPYRGGMFNPDDTTYLNRAVRKMWEQGPVDFVLEQAFGGTPGYDYMVQVNKDAQATGSNQGFDRWKDNAWTALTALQVPQKALATEKIPGTNYSTGEVLGAAGKALNQTLNPFLPERVQVDLSKEMTRGPLSPLQGPFAAAYNIFMDTLDKSQKARSYLEGLPPEQQREVNASLQIIGSSGGDKVMTAAKNILSQTQDVTNLQNLAQARKTELQNFMDARPWPLTKKDMDYADNLAYEAAEYGRQANLLRQKTKVEFIDDQTNIWGEIMEGVFADPLNYITLGPSKEALLASRATQLMNVPEKEAIRLLDEVTAGRQIPTLWEEAIGKEPVKWLNYINPFNLNPRTAETKAELATDTLWRTATQLLTDVTDKETARAVIQTWVTNPRLLVEGVQTPAGIIKAGPGLLANDEVIRQYDVLKRAGEALLNMDALKGAGGFNPVEVYAKMEDIIYKAARDAQGLRVLQELPEGALRARLRKTDAGSAVIEYLDKKGKILKTSAEMTTYDAELAIKDLRKAQATAAGGRPATGALMNIWNTQKAILSDMYLGQSPGYWLKNGLGMTVHLLADDSYTLLPTKRIIGDLQKKFGVMPTRQSFDAVEGMTGGGVTQGAIEKGTHWLERYIGENPYSKVMKKLYQIPYGNTSIAGRVPLGEENGRLRGYYTPFVRTLAKAWSQEVDSFTQELIQSGISEPLAKSFSAIVRETGINGNKQEMIAAARKAVTAVTHPYTLTELGVPDELVTPDAWKALSETFASFTPDRAQEAAAEVARIFREEIMQPAQVLNSAPPQPARSIFTESASLQDSATFVDDMISAAKRAGMNIDTVRTEAEQLAQQIDQAEKTLWQSIREEIATSDDPASMQVALDVLAQWYDWRQSARQAVDNASRLALQTNTTAAWERKFAETRRVYGEFTPWFTEVVTNARAALINKTPTGYDWFKTIQRYIDYDEAVVQAERTAGMTLKSPRRVADAEQWRKTIDAGRQYIDKTFIELFHAFRRYPTQEGLDLLASGVRQVEDMGAQTAYAIREKAAEFLPKRAQDFYKFRNQAWAQFFDNGAVSNRVTTRLITANGIAQDIPGQLKWVDDFAGGEFQLIGRGANGLWDARHVATGEIHQFADPVKLAAKRMQGPLTGSAPEVPQEILSAYYKALGEVEPTVDQMIAEITAEAAAATQTPTRQALTTADLLAKGDALADLPAEQKAATVLRPTQAGQQPPATQLYQPSQQQVEQVRASVQKAIERSAERNKFTTQQVEQYVQQALTQISQADIAVAVPKSTIDNILSDGRLKTQFETGTSGATTNKAWRAEAELKGLGIPETLPDAQRPIYGYMNFSPETRSLTQRGYGDITFILDEKVRGRTTIGAGDTMDNFRRGNMVAAPIDSPNILAADHEVSNLVDYARTGDAKEFVYSGVGYVEAQVQGGVSLDDVAYVLDEKGALTPQQVQQFSARGIQVLQGDAAKTVGKLPTRTVQQPVAPTVAPVVEASPAAPLTLNDLRRLAGEAGIQTASEAGQPINKRLLNTINKDLKIKAARLEDLTPDQIEQAAEALRVRAAKNAGIEPPSAPTFGMGIVPFDMLAWLLEQEARRGSLYDILPGLKELDFFGLGQKGGNLYKLIRGLNRNAADVAGHKAPEIGEIAAHTIRTLTDAEQRIIQRLPEILAGKPNQLTPAQQVAVVDALNRLAPRYDDALATANKVGEDMANWTMLNYNDKRLLDVMLGFGFSFPYYYTHTGWNWIQRIMHKPGILNLWYETQRAIDLENDQANVPDHLRGTLPSPLPVGPQRLGNPLTWLLPIASYMGNQFIDPEEAKTEGDKYAMYVQKYLPALQPVLGYALALQQDMTSPLPNGKKRTDAIQLGDYAPLYRMGGYAYQAATGDMGPQGFLAWGDEYDYGRAGKQVGLQAMSAGTDPSKQTWALDVGLQQQTGVDALPEQPSGVTPLWEAGAGRAGYERLMNRATSFVLGVPSYYLSPEEQQMRAMKEERQQLGYDPITNPYGSKAAVEQRTGMDGDIYDAAFNYSQLYPGMPPRDRPGIAAARNDYWAKADPIYDKMNQAVADYVTKNPEATTSDVAKVRKPFFDQVAELKKQYPSAFQEGEGPKPPNTRYMNPREEAEAAVARVLEFEPPNKPEHPGDEADPATLRTYYDAKAKWEKARLDQIDRTFNQMMGEESSYPDPWRDQARKLIKEKYSSELLRMYENRNATEIERHWNDRQTFVEEVETAEWKRREGAVRDRLGDAALKAFQTYLDLDKGDPRKEYKEANPLAAMALFVAFNPNAYDQFVQKFGEKGLDIAYKTQMPEHPGDGASDAALQQYYGLRDAYNKKYPQAEEVRLWLWGRRFGAANGTDDYGVAHEEALRIFGPDIFTILNSFPAGGTKQEIAQWYKANGKAADLRNGYFAWKREYNEADKATLGQEPEERPTFSNAGAGQGYTGPRPVGEAYVPIGSNEWWNPNAPTPLEQLRQGPDLRQMGKMGPPSRWDALSQEVYGTTQNPWTQRAGELNAALFQGATIPDQMGPPRPTATSSAKTAEEYAAMAADKNYKGGRRSNRRSYYSRGGGGGYRRSYGGGGGGSSGFRYPQMPDAQGLSSSLWSQDDVRAWRPWNNQANDWLRSGQELRPDRLEDWRPLRV